MSNCNSAMISTGGSCGGCQNYQRFYSKPWNLCGGSFGYVPYIPPVNEDEKLKKVLSEFVIELMKKKETI